MVFVPNMLSYRRLAKGITIPLNPQNALNIECIEAKCFSMKTTQKQFLFEQGINEKSPPKQVEKAKLLYRKIYLKEYQKQYRKNKVRKNLTFDREEIRRVKREANKREWPP